MMTAGMPVRPHGVGVGEKIADKCVRSTMDQ